MATFVTTLNKETECFLVFLRQGNSPTADRSRQGICQIASHPGQVVIVQFPIGPDNVIVQFLVGPDKVIV
jgi:hypothetical protein